MVGFYFQRQMKNYISPLYSTKIPALFFTSIVNKFKIITTIDFYYTLIVFSTKNCGYAYNERRIFHQIKEKKNFEVKLFTSHWPQATEKQYIMIKTFHPSSHFIFFITSPV